MPKKRVTSDSPERALIERGLAALGARDCATAMRLFREGERRYPAWPSFIYNAACCLALQGKVDEALDDLERALARGYSNYPNLETDPDLASLRAHERYKLLHARYVPNSKYRYGKTLFRGVRIPRYLVNDIEDAQRLTHYRISGRRYRRVPFSDPDLDRCTDCGVFHGQLHQPGCDLEPCPKCGRQAIACEHLEDELYGG